MNIVIIKLAAGLLLLILANIAIGSVDALIAQAWDWSRFWRGIMKGLTVAAALIAVYYAGYLNPDLFVIDAGGEQINLMAAVYMTLLAGYTVYATKVVKALYEIIIKTTDLPESKKETEDDGKA